MNTPKRYAVGVAARVERETGTYLTCQTHLIHHQPDAKTAEELAAGRSMLALTADGSIVKDIVCVAVEVAD